MNVIFTKMPAKESLKACHTTSSLCRFSVIQVRLSGSSVKQESELMKCPVTMNQLSDTQQQLASGDFYLQCLYETCVSYNIL